ncbi:MAG: hypothetical protein GY777_30595 [Candidatus Brocadiaceae bacterium]|nr:hypothetical protein [Candidatus Brocadiaceae bacterium]
MNKLLNCGIKHKRLVSIAQLVCFFLVIGGSLSLPWASRAESGVSKVRVHNQMDTPIWVIIAENQKHVIETKTRTVGDVEFEAYYKIMVEGGAKIPIEGIPVDASFKESSEFRTKLKEYYEENKEEKYEWSGFIVAGELEVAPGKPNNWSRKGDEKIYYISIRTTQAHILADAVPRSEETITVDASGHIVDDVPAGERIKNGMPVYFESKSKFIGDPITHARWDAGTFDNTGGLHQIVTWDDKPPLQTGVFVRIISNSKTLAAGEYKHMYSAESGWVYYDKKRDNSKQQWKISKTDSEGNSLGEELCYGDEVKISNGWWPKANLGTKNTWLQCVNNDRTTWILRKEPRKITKK